MQIVQATICFTTFVLLFIPHEAAGNGVNVTLKPLPVKNDYAASDSDYDDGGLGPLFNFARSFINTALPGGYPMTFINETARNIHDSKFGIGDLTGFLNNFKGYGAAIAIGLLFIIIFPFVGTCFCCCRLCGNCGGKGQQEVTDKLHLKRRIFAAILFVLTTFTLVGNICTYVSNSRMSVALGKIGETVENNLDDMDSYLDLVEQQVLTIGQDNLHTTKDGILHFMDQTKLEQEISEYVLNALSGGALDKMQQHIETTAKAFGDVVNSKNTIATLAATNGLPSPVGSPHFSTLSTKKAAFDNFKNTDVVKQVKDEVITKIHGNLGAVSTKKADVVAAFANIEPKVQNVVDQIKSFRSNAKSGLDLEDYKDKAKSFTGTMKDYDKYRYAAAAGLAGITTLIVTLQFLGLGFGSVGQGWATEPSNRGCVSTAGGNFLMASVGFIFIFSSLLMLLTTICFSLGALLERFVCQPLSSDDLQLLKIVDPFFPTQDTLRADLSDIMRDCRDDKSAYTAFHLEPKVHLNTLDQTLDTEKQKIHTAFQSVLGGAGSVSSVDFTTATNSLSQFSTALSGMNFGSMKAVIQQAHSTVPPFPQAAAYRLALQNMMTAIQTLETEQTSSATTTADFQNGLNHASSRISAQMASLLATFQTKITDIIDQYVNSTKQHIKENMGRCSPVWNLYESILVVAVCKYTIDAFNGFWFSIGWCIFFFVPSTVFSVKLAKHYRRMDSLEHGNKVGHMDNAPMVGY